MKDYPKIPVVIASGYGAVNVEFLLGEKLPSVLMLPKPYDLPALERTLSEAAAIAATNRVAAFYRRSKVLRTVVRTTVVLPMRYSRAGV